jgi:hypothetical protein
MLLAGIVAATFMGAGCAIIAADSPFGRIAAYAIHRWRRARRQARRSAPAETRAAAGSAPAPSRPARA